MMHQEAVQDEICTSNYDQVEKENCSLYLSREIDERRQKSDVILRSPTSTKYMENECTTSSLDFMLYKNVSNFPNIADQHFTPSDATTIDECIQARDDLDLIGDNRSGYYLPISRKTDIIFVSVDTVAKLVSQKASNFGGLRGGMKHFFIIDCRYNYEYDGGHVRNAIKMECCGGLSEVMGLLQNGNLFDKKRPSAWNEVTSTSFMTGDTPPWYHSNIILILHCEFSTQRAPAVARRLRAEDRRCNRYRYPFLYFPEIYVMDGGYSKFYQHYPQLCEPDGYVTMRDSRFKEECIQQHTMMSRHKHVSHIHRPLQAISTLNKPKKRPLTASNENEDNNDSKNQDLNNKYFHY